MKGKIMGSIHSMLDSKGRPKVECLVCGAWHHRLDVHLSKRHGITVKDYKEKHPGAKTISDAAQESARVSQKKVVEKNDIHVEVDMAAGEDFSVLPIGVAKLVVRKDLTAGDLARVPQHDENWWPGEREKEQLECLALGIQNRENVFIFGPTGCGKTTIINELAALLCQPVVRVQANRKLTIEDFIGQNGLDVVDGKHVTIWKDGVLPQAMRNGWWIVLDELCGADPGILLRLQAVLEGGALILTENYGEVVVPHSHFRIIASDNTNGHGDNSGLYAGLNVMNEATMDRFGVVIKAEYPSADVEKEILVRKGGVPTSQASKMVEVALRVREAMLAETCYCTFSTRRLIAWAKKSQQMRDVRRSARITVINKLSPEDGKFVDGLIQRYFGGDV
jgi:cobaltochelatase CobS